MQTAEHETRTAFLQFGSGSEPRATVKAEAVRLAPLWHHEAGLSYTASGYGAKIPSAFMVRHEGRWRRVYVTQYGNAGSAWVTVDGARVGVDIY